MISLLHFLPDAYRVLLPGLTENGSPSSTLSAIRMARSLCRRAPVAFQLIPIVLRAWLAVGRDAAASCCPASREGVCEDLNAVAKKKQLR